MVPNCIVSQGARTNLTIFPHSVYKLDNGFNGSENNSQIEPTALAIVAYEMARTIFSSNDLNKGFIQQKNKEYVLSIKANPDYGLPFGLPSKLLLALIVDEVKKTKSPVLRLRKIYSKLFKIFLPLQEVSGQNTNIFLYNHMLGFFSAKISFTYLNKNITFDFWWNRLKGKKKNISSGSTVVLTKNLFDGLLNYSSNYIELTPLFLGKK